MTYAQMEAFDSLLERLGVTRLTHGDCVGADEDAHEIALARDIPIHLRPCDIRSQRAFCRGAAREHLPKPPLARNPDIVDDGDVLIATPAGPEVVRSGTWSTVRHARRRGRTRYIIWPDGAVERET